MGLLPEKDGPQLWTDVVLPLFDQPQAKPERVRSKKQDADEAGIRWVRYKGRRTGCDECILAVRRGTATSVGDAVYLRTHGPNSQYLCTRHTADQRDTDNLRKDI